MPDTVRPLWYLLRIPLFLPLSCWVGVLRVCLCNHACCPRMVRVFRVLRLMRHMKSMQMIVEVVTLALPSIVSIFTLLAMFSFVYAPPRLATSVVLCLPYACLSVSLSCIKCSHVSRVSIQGCAVWVMCVDTRLTRVTMCVCLVARADLRPPPPPPPQWCMTCMVHTQVCLVGHAALGHPVQ